MKDKAKALVRSFEILMKYDFISPSFNDPFKADKNIKTNAKMCAIICVDEIIKEVITWIQDGNTNVDYTHYEEYKDWILFKNEINKL